MSELGSATLIRRYKRFLADVRLADGQVLTIHCPNTGSMKNCQQEGARVWFSTSGNPGRKYPHTWELIATEEGHMINVNAASANRIVRAAIEDDKVSQLGGYEQLVAEVPYGQERSRIDLLLQGNSADLPDCYVEVKSVTLLDETRSAGAGFFPDAVSDRGSRHLRELESVVRAGKRAVLFYCVQHTGIRRVEPADQIDPEYGKALRQAVSTGVEVLAYGTDITPEAVTLTGSLPFYCP